MDTLMGIALDVWVNIDDDCAIEYEVKRRLNWGIKRDRFTLLRQKRH